MWEKWFQKIKDLFSSEEEEYTQKWQSSEPYSKQNITAKVAYQYPKERNFRFPVIPDDSVKKEKTKVKDDIDIPAYLRRNEQEQQLVNPKKQVQSEKKTKEPFKVTEIPSPIDGFKKKQKGKEIDQIPAYIRREQEKDLHKETQVIDDKAIAVVPAPAAGEIASTAEKTEQNKSGFLNYVERKNIETGENTNLRKDAENASPQISQGIGESTNDINQYKSNNYEEETQDLDEVYSGEEIHKKQNEKEDRPASFITNEKEGGHHSEKSTTFPLRIKEEVNIPEAHKEKTEERPLGMARANRKQRKAETESSHVPFNVLMTQRDRLNWQVQQKNGHPTNSQRKLGEGEVSRSQGNSRQMAKVNTKTKEKEQFIPLHLLNDPIPRSYDNRFWIEEQQRLLEETLKHFHVKASVVRATQGPAVTRFEVHPQLGVKVSKIKNLSDDLKLNMKAKDIRIEAPIPGKNTVGIEVPNEKAHMVGLQEVFETEEFQQSTSPLTIALGLSIEGKPKITNIQKMPHGLIAGATGSGKSVCINTILISILYKASYDEVKFLLIDPKMVELAPYNGIPHLVAPVITDVKAATQSLKWAVNEMEERYEKFVQEGVRNIEGYNRKLERNHREQEKMPFIVIVIDELADLMMTSPQDVEESISRIAQKARACGIHLILATQRPSVDVITGLIKANIPTRIAFSVSSQVDSRTIIDISGAEKLLGKGDMLFLENGSGKTVRLQGPFVSDEEIERVTNYVRTLKEPEYLFEQEELLEQIYMDEEEDELMQEVIDFVIQQNSASTSLLQRRFKIGYNRAARLMDTLENRGIISGQNGSKPREVLVSKNYDNENG